MVFFLGSSQSMDRDFNSEPANRKRTENDGLDLKTRLLLLSARRFRIRVPILAVAYLHYQAHGGPSSTDKELEIHHSESWFFKVVSTLFVHSHRLELCCGYLQENLTPEASFEVIKRFNNPVLALRFLEFCRLNFDMNHCLGTYNFLLRSLCRMGYHDSLIVVSDYMRSDGHLPDRYLIEFLVSSLLRAGKSDIAKRLISEVCGKEVVISTLVYNKLLTDMVKQNQVHEAICLFKEHLMHQSPPDTWTFNILIQGLCRIGKVDKACEFFNEMGRFGCLPDLVTYNTLINGFCKIGKVDRGIGFLKDMQSRNDCSPDVLTYTFILSALCKLRKMEDACLLFEEMVRSGITPNSFTFNVLIDGYGKTCDMVAAESLYDKMVASNCRPDVVTFTSLIDGFCRSGQLNLGLKLWNAMKVKNVPPNVYTYAILINSLCKENRLNEARDFLRQLKISSIVPKAFMYNPVIDGFCKAGNVDEANVIVAEMEEKQCRPDKVTFTILIIGHCVKGRMLEGISFFDKMLEIGCAPDDITVNSLISCLLKAGMPNEAFRIAQVARKDLSLGSSSCRRTISGINTDITTAAY